MEARKITVVSNKSNCTVTFNSKASNLAELKEEMKFNNIDYKDCLFSEGISKTKFTQDDQQLPLSVMYKGRETKDLVFMLSVTSENIQSGNSSNRKVLLDVTYLLELKKA